MKVLVTGTAGFIGSHVAQVLLARGDTVIGFDSLNDYYDVTLKQARLARFIDHPGYVHIQADLADRAAVRVEHLPLRGDCRGEVSRLHEQRGTTFAQDDRLQPGVLIGRQVRVGVAGELLQAAGAVGEGGRLGLASGEVEHVGGRRPARHRGLLDLDLLACLCLDPFGDGVEIVEEVVQLGLDR